MAKIFQTKAYKVITGFVYGWGATAVIVGALFKIMHFPGAGIVLTVGMLVEAFIFFLSAFEPVMEHYDWARVFPELGTSGEKVPTWNLIHCGGMHILMRHCGPSCRMGRTNEKEETVHCHNAFELSY